MPVYIGKSGDLVRCYRCLTHRQQKIGLLSFSTVSSLSWVTQSVVWHGSESASTMYFQQFQTLCAHSPAFKITKSTIRIFVNISRRTITNAKTAIGVTWLTTLVSNSPVWIAHSLHPIGNGETKTKTNTKSATTGRNCENCPTQVSWNVKFRCQLCLS